MQSDYILYMFINYFRIAKHTRRKYKLCVNPLLVLVSVYVYSKVIKQSFTRNHILDFARYYDNIRMNKYFTVLFKLGYIVQSGNDKKGYQLYSISPVGIQIIEEMKGNYTTVMDGFISKYNIQL